MIGVRNVCLQAVVSCVPYQFIGYYCTPNGEWREALSTRHTNVTVDWQTDGQTVEQNCHIPLHTTRGKTFKCTRPVLSEFFLTTVVKNVFVLFFIVYPMHNWIDPLISFFPTICLSVSLCVCEQMALERLRPQFVTAFHEILHAAQKCGHFVAYCL